MAKRSREHRNDIPGYDESRPSRDERKQKHRQVRHNTHQLLHMVDDPDELSDLPEVKRSRKHEIHTDISEPKKRRFKVWKTKFWKRRDGYQGMKSELDADWPVITTEQLRKEQA